MKKVYICLNYFRSIIPLLLLNRNLLFLSDIERWMTIRKVDNGNRSKLFYFTYFCLFYKEFRNIVLYRARNNIFSFLVCRLFWRPMDTLFINCKDIGGGLFIEHGFATIISAKRIGVNCWINQQVTIGYTNGKDAPTIGDNVSIKAGAIVIGDVFVGNNSIVGAGAVVTKDVNPNAVVVGVPAHEIRTVKN